MFECPKHCRWCGKHYRAAQPHGKDGFCSGAHKQALYRARKKCVTAKKPARAARGTIRRTRK